MLWYAMCTKAPHFGTLVHTKAQHQVGTMQADLGKTVKESTGLVAEVMVNLYVVLDL